MASLVAISTVPPSLSTAASRPVTLAGEAPEVTFRQVGQLFGEVLRADVLGVLGLRLLMIALLIVATMIVLRVGRRLILDLQQARQLPDSVVLPVRRTLRWAIIVLALVLALQFAGFSVTSIWATLSAVLALFAVAFIAVWSVLSNIACSVMLMVFKPFRIGDHVELLDKPEGPNIGGRVTDLTLMYVVLREESAEGGPPAFIQVPNNIFFQRTIRRRSGKRTVTLEQHVEKHGLTGRQQSPPAA